MTDVVVIGAGLTGLTCAARLATRGRSVVVVSTGIGGLQLGQGSIDVFGYDPDRVEHPLDAASAVADDHPYARIGRDRICVALQWFAELMGTDQLVGSIDRNMLLPTAIGVARPTTFAPPSMAGGDLHVTDRYAIVGFPVVKDLHPHLVADNLSRARRGNGGTLEARGLLLDIAARDGEVDSSAVSFARAMDDATFRGRVADALRDTVDANETVGLPAVIGLGDAHTAWQDLQERSGRAIFEIPLAPPSVPGMRLNAALTARVRATGGRIIIGGAIIGAMTEGRRLMSVVADTAGRRRTYTAAAFIHCPGGFESGALTIDSYGAVSETALGLPLTGVPEPDAQFDVDYWADHPVLRAGVAVDESQRVLDTTGTPVHENLFAAGGIIAGASRWREKSGDGIAIASAVSAADAAFEETA